MQNKKKDTKSRIVTIVATSMLLMLNIGCAMDNRLKNPEIIGSGTPKETLLPVSEKGSVDDEEKKIIGEPQISSEYYSRLGGLDENVVKNGSHRDESEVIVAKDKLLFPQGAVRSIAIGCWSRQDKAVRPPKSEVDAYLDAIENAKIIKEKDVPDTILDKAFIETHVLLLNSHGEFRIVDDVYFAEGYHQILVEKDDINEYAKSVRIKCNGKKKVSSVFLRSKKACKYIKNWMHWEKDAGDAFSKIEKATFSSVFNHCAVSLREDEIRLLKKYLKYATKNELSPCGHEYYYVCKLKNGKDLHLSISADAECVSVDGNVYSVDYSHLKLMKRMIRQNYNLERR